MTLLDNNSDTTVVAFKHQTPQPGVLRSQATLTIQTRYGQTFIYGRPRDDKKGKNQIPGLLDYARRVRLIWLSVIADDPYADWQLVKIEQSLSAAKQRIREHDFMVRERLESNQGIKIEPAHSVEPVTIELNFQNAYGYLAAGLVSEYDQLACHIFAASHVGVLAKKEGYQILDRAGIGIRRLYATTYGWKYTGVTRQDVLKKTQIAQRAVEIMGDCLPEILDMSQRATNAPDVQMNMNS
jgi:integrating conjugative element protein (TIGR03761 family)